MKMINAHTELYGIIGNPVRHSLSPVIHNGAFRRMGLNAVYLAFEVNRPERSHGRHQRAGGSWLECHHSV